MDRSVTTQGLSAGGFFLLLCLAVGCGRPGDAYVVSRLALDRHGWDTLDVQVDFARHTLFGGAVPAPPQATAIVVFSAAYDTLYAGADHVIALDDRKLGDRERLMVEVCGTFDAVTVCEQDAITASPKRLRLQHQIAFPEDVAYERGSYDLRFVVERQAFQGEQWAPIQHTGRVRGYLLAYVGERAAEAVKVPFSRARGRFDLKSYPRFKDFQFNLKSQLYDEQQAEVRFDVYAGLNDQLPYRLASVEMLVQEKTEEERRLEVYHFAEQAAGRVLDVLDEGEDRAFAYVDGWDFKPLTHAYLVELELVWRAGGRFFGRLYRLSGLLEVKEDGSGARFLYRGGSERAARHWRRTVRGETLVLGGLEPYVHEEEDARDPLKAEADGASQRVQRGGAGIE